ncbi:MAG: folylpolyglutamate synthase/dihydrofolate synthase family protein [Bacteroidales bacterium]|jgi:dihydrofolate synthase/folylpolyglutamate synthase|nr:folylpolyglutamate synthase/dihydrofolate synthase family protein [Bacteroidales bacterium]
MNYDQILEKIFNSFPMYHKIGSSAYKEGLENIEILAAITNHPETKFKSIHVAGTNGKGSVSHLLASFFQEAGYKTGLFSSPHLVDFRERIKINGEMISKERVIRFFDRYQSQIDPIEPSFFEITTILAFDYFAEEQVDIAIIETGLGGRLDATNILNPILSIVTNISFDHAQLLGNTLPKIAFEKAGIIKPNTPVLIGEADPKTLPVFQAVASQKNAPCYVADKIKLTIIDDTDPFDTHVSVKYHTKMVYPDLILPIPGAYQLKNIATYLHALEILKSYFKINNDYAKPGIENVVKNTHLMGRWQVLTQYPLVICDVAHNIGAFNYLIPQISSLPVENIHMILGFVDDKDLDPILNILPKNIHYYLCKAPVQRALNPKKMLVRFKELDLKAQILDEQTYKTFLKVQEISESNDLILITGSFFIVGDFLKHYPDLVL